MDFASAVQQDLSATDDLSNPPRSLGSVEFVEYRKDLLDDHTGQELVTRKILSSTWWYVQGLSSVSS
jgi:hypothetical protein